MSREKLYAHDGNLERRLIKQAESDEGLVDPPPKSKSLTPLQVKEVRERLSKIRAEIEKVNKNLKALTRK